MPLLLCHHPVLVFPCFSRLPEHPPCSGHPPATLGGDLPLARLISSRRVPGQLLHSTGSSCELSADDCPAWTFRSDVCPEFQRDLSLPLRYLHSTVLIRPHTQDIQSGFIFSPNTLFLSFVYLLLMEPPSPELLKLESFTSLFFKTLSILPL